MGHLSRILQLHEKRVASKPAVGWAELLEAVVLPAVLLQFLYD